MKPANATAVIAVISVVALSQNGTAAAQTAAKPPPNFLNACLASAHPNGLVDTGISVSDLVHAVALLPGSSAKWDRIATNSFVLRLTARDPVTAKVQNASLVFAELGGDQPAGKQCGPRSVALVRMVDEGVDRSPIEVYAFATVLTRLLGTDKTWVEARRKPAAPSAAPRPSAAVAALSRPPTVVTAPRWATKATAADLSRHYPPRAREQEIEGRATVECTVRSDGALSECRATDESPIGVGFGEATARLAEQLMRLDVGESGPHTEGAAVRFSLRWTLP